MLYDTYLSILHIHNLMTLYYPNICIYYNLVNCYHWVFVSTYITAYLSIKIFTYKFQIMSLRKVKLSCQSMWIFLRQCKTISTLPFKFFQFKILPAVQSESSKHTVSSDSATWYLKLKISQSIPQSIQNPKQRRKWKYDPPLLIYLTWIWLS